MKTGRLSTYTSTSTSTNITGNKAKAAIKICFEFNTGIWEALCHFWTHGQVGIPKTLTTQKSIPLQYIQYAWRTLGFRKKLYYSPFRISYLVFWTGACYCLFSKYLKICLFYLLKEVTKYILYLFSEPGKKVFSLFWACPPISENLLILSAFLYLKHILFKLRS